MVVKKITFTFGLLIALFGLACYSFAQPSDTLLVKVTVISDTTPPAHLQDWPR